MVPVISGRIDVPDSGLLTLSVRVANFAYERGGIDSSIEIGTDQALLERRESQLISSSFVAGALLIMALYHVGLWFKRKEDLSALTFAFFCFAIGIRMLCTNEKILQILLPSISAELMISIELATVYSGMPIIHFFVHTLFPKHSPRKLVLVSVGAFVVLSAALLTGNLLLASSMILYFEIYVLLMLLTVLVVGIRARLNAEEGSSLFLIGLVLIFIAAIRDVLIERGILSGLYSLHYGVLAFVFAQSALLSSRFANAYNGLQVMKGNLEGLVEERTVELKMARDQAIAVGEQNRKLSTRMTTLLEKERRDIAKEIHDNFSSRLVAARMHVNSIIKQLTKNAIVVSDILDSASKINENLKESYTDARALVSRLRPEVIDTLGLAKALSELCNNYDSNQINVVFRCLRSDVETFDSDTKIALYRIAQEAITNALKYSRGTEIVVKLFPGIGPVLSISDNGIGFNPNANTGNGISHMRERAMSIGGSLNIFSGDTGTDIEVAL